MPNRTQQNYSRISKDHFQHLPFPKKMLVKTLYPNPRKPWLVIIPKMVPIAIWPSPFSFPLPPLRCAEARRTGWPGPSIWWQDSRGATRRSSSGKWWSFFRVAIWLGVKSFSLWEGFKDVSKFKIQGFFLCFSLGIISLGFVYGKSFRFFSSECVFCLFVPCNNAHTHSLPLSLSHLCVFLLIGKIKHRTTSENDLGRHLQVSSSSEK